MSCLVRTMVWFCICMFDVVLRNKFPCAGHWFYCVGLGVSAALPTADSNDNIACIHMRDECMRSRVRNVCHMLWFIFWAFSRNIKYQVYQYDPKYKYFRTLCEQQIPFLLLWIDGHQCMELQLLCNCWIVLFANSQSFRVFLCMTFHVIRLRGNVCLKFPWTKQLLSRTSRDPGFEHIPVIVCNIIACLTLSLSATQKYMVKAWCPFFQNNVFHQYVPSRIVVLFRSSHFYIVHKQKLESSLSFDAKAFPV